MKRYIIISVTFIIVVTGVLWLQEMRWKSKSEELIEKNLEFSRLNYMIWHGLMIDKDLTEREVSRKYAIYMSDIWYVANKWRDDAFIGKNIPHTHHVEMIVDALDLTDPGDFRNGEWIRSSVYFVSPDDESIINENVELVVAYLEQNWPNK